MKRYNLLCLTVAAGLVAGCASTPPQTADAPQRDKTSVTGSRLPSRDADVKSVSNKSDITDIMQRSNTNNLPSMGGGK